MAQPVSLTVTGSTLFLSTSRSTLLFLSRYFPSLSRGYKDSVAYIYIYIYIVGHRIVGHNGSAVTAREKTRRTKQEQFASPRNNPFIFSKRKTRYRISLYPWIVFNLLSSFLSKYQIFLFFFFFPEIHRIVGAHRRS